MCNIYTNPAVTIHKLNQADKQLIEQIANWYFIEWAIPREKTISRLTNHPNDDILFQVILRQDDIPVATGGLYNNVGLLHDHPKYRKYKPWVALLYTDIQKRNKGFATKLLDSIEDVAAAMGIAKLYLYTFTAEALYTRNGWTPIGRVDYRGHDTVIMDKEL